MARDLALEEFPAQLQAQFEPLRTLGAGGMGVVYQARDRVLNRLVTVKLIRGGGPGGPSTSSPTRPGSGARTWQQGTSTATSTTRF